MPETESSPADTLQRLTGIVARQRWWILLITSVAAFGTVAAVYRIPNKYMSEATLIVVPQQIPSRYVTPTTETNIADSLQAMTQDVLSRARLLELIDQFGLYPNERKRLAPEEVIDLMRNYIQIQPIDPNPGRKEINSFKISFVAEKAVLAQEVTSKLTSFFIQANLKTREDQATNTTNFLEARLETARTKLVAQEQRLRDFKIQYLGELPEQQQSNLAILNSAQAQLQNTSSSLDRAQQQRTYIESLLNAYQRLIVRGAPVQGVVPGPETARPPSPVQIAQNDLARLQSERAKLVVTYKPTYPDVLAIDRAISADQAVLEKLRASTPSETGNARELARATAAPAAEALEDDSSTAQLKSQLESNRLEIENLTREEARQKDIISQYQNRLNQTPVREEQLSTIQTDYDLSKKDYEDLLSKEQQSQLAMSLEKQQGGQQFRLVEPPSLPALPSTPNRVKLSLGGFGAGLVLGLVIVFVKELARPTLNTTREVTQRFGAPLVISLPVVLTRAEQRRRGWRKTFEVLGGSVLASAICIAEFYVLRHP